MVLTWDFLCVWCTHDQDLFVFLLEEVGTGEGVGVTHLCVCSFYTPNCVDIPCLFRFPVFCCFIGKVTPLLFFFFFGDTSGEETDVVVRTPCLTSSLRRDKEYLTEQRHEGEQSRQRKTAVCLRPLLSLVPLPTLPVLRLVKFSRFQPTCNSLYQSAGLGCAAVTNSPQLSVA